MSTTTDVSTLADDIALAASESANDESNGASTAQIAIGTAILL